MRGSNNVHENHAEPRRGQEWAPPFRINRRRRSCAAAIAVIAVAGAATGMSMMNARGAAGHTQPAAPPGEMEQFHESLRLLQAGQADQADRLATALAENARSPLPRAWLVAARARQDLRSPENAAKAYRAFLAASDSSAGREYVQSQIRLCEAATRPAGPQAPPSERLTEEEKESLAAVSEDLAVEESEHFTVRARNALLARLAANEAETALSRIGGLVLGGQEYAHHVDLHIWADPRDYLAHAPGALKWAGGHFTLTRQDAHIVRRVDLAQLDADRRFETDTLDRALPHELCHLLVAEFFGDAPCPLFLTEGLAMLAEPGAGADRLALAGTAMAGRERIPLADLLVVEPGRVAKPDLFYAECYSLASFLRQRLGGGQFAAMMEHLKGGSDLPDAIQRAIYSVPREDFLELLAAEWERQAIEQAQYIRALQTRSRTSAPAR
jgi:hypothetical protein